MTHPMPRPRWSVALAAPLVVALSFFACRPPSRADDRHIVCPDTFYLTQIRTPVDRDIPPGGGLLFDTRRRDGSITGTDPAIYDHALEAVLPTRRPMALEREGVRIPLVVTPMGGGFFRGMPATTPAPGEYVLVGFDRQGLRVRFGATPTPGPTTPAVREVEHGERDGDIVRYRTGVYFAEALPRETTAVALVPDRGREWIVFDRFGHEPPNWAGTEGTSGGPCLPPLFERRIPRDGLRVRVVVIDRFARTSAPGAELRIRTNTEIPEHVP